jgi:hypothetical protein
MAMAVQETTAAALAPAQLKSQLWADPAQTVYAVPMGTRLQGLPARLAAELAGNGIEDYDCLLPGALLASQQAEAPYLVRLRRDTAFGDWLLFEAAATLGEWGVVVTSTLRMTALRSHLRSLRVANLPSGGTVTLDWMDPAVLRLLLPLFDAGTLARILGPIGTLVMPGDGRWTVVRAPLGRLDQADLRYQRQR